MIEAIPSDGLVLAYLARGGALPETTTFLTPNDCNLQVGHVLYPAGGEIARHMHLPLASANPAVPIRTKTNEEGTTPGR